MAKWLKYKLHDKESKSNSNLITWIKLTFKCKDFLNVN